MPIKIFDQSSGLDEFAKAIPAAIEGYYKAKESKLREMELAARLKVDNERKEREQALDRIKFEQDYGLEIPKETSGSDMYGLVAGGMLGQREGFVSQKDLRGKLTELQIEQLTGKPLAETKKQIIDLKKQGYEPILDDEGKIVDIKPGEYLSEKQKLELAGKKADINKKNAPKAAAKPKPTVGEQAVDRNFGKEYSEFIGAGGYTALDAAINDFEKAIERMEKAKPSKYVGLLPGATREYLAPEASAIQQQLEKVVQGSLRETLGAQFTAREGEQVLERSYNPRLDAKENVKRARAELNKLRAKAEAKKAAAKYFEENGTLSGFRGSQNVGTKPQTGPHGNKVIQNGVEYIWNPETGKYE